MSVYKSKEEKLRDEALLAVQRSDDEDKKAIQAYIEFLEVDRASEKSLYSQFINSIWALVESEYNWEYPAQVIRTVQDELKKNHAEEN